MDTDSAALAAGGFAFAGWLSVRTWHVSRPTVLFAVLDYREFKSVRAVAANLADGVGSLQHQWAEWYRILDFLQREVEAGRPVELNFLKGPVRQYAGMNFVALKALGTAGADTARFYDEFAALRVAFSALANELLTCDEQRARLIGARELVIGLERLSETLLPRLQDLSRARYRPFGRWKQAFEDAQ